MLRNSSALCMIDAVYPRDIHMITKSTETLHETIGADLEAISDPLDLQDMFNIIARSPAFGLQSWMKDLEELDADMDRTEISDQETGKV